MPRETFLARVRNATMMGRKYRVPIGHIPEGTGYVGGGADLAVAFTHEVIAVGGHAYLVDDWAGAATKFAELLDDIKPTQALTWQHDLLDRIGVSKILAERAIRHFSHQNLASLSLAEQRQTVLDCDLGISSIDWGIAETGTMIVRSRPGRERMVSLVPPIHLAIIERSQIIPDLFDLFTLLQSPETGELPSNLAFITGPSKTGDIELQLTAGIHGPGTWIALVIRT